MMTIIVRLTPRTLGDYRRTRLARLARSDLVLGDDAELVLLTFKQVGHVQLAAGRFDLERDPAPADVRPSLDDVSGDGCSAV